MLSNFVLFETKFWEIYLSCFSNSLYTLLYSPVPDTVWVLEVAGSIRIGVKPMKIIKNSLRTLLRNKIWKWSVQNENNATSFGLSPCYFGQLVEIGVQSVKVWLIFISCTHYLVLLLHLICHYLLNSHPSISSSFQSSSICHHRCTHKRLWVLW